MAFVCVLCEEYRMWYVKALERICGEEELLDEHSLIQCHRVPEGLAARFC